MKNKWKSFFFVFCALLLVVLTPCCKTKDLSDKLEIIYLDKNGDEQVEYVDYDKILEYYNVQFDYYDEEEEDAGD